MMNTSVCSKTVQCNCCCDDPIDCWTVLPRVKTCMPVNRFLLPERLSKSLNRQTERLAIFSKLQHGVTGNGLNDYDQI